jgi:hypothetical protein
MPKTPEQLAAEQAAKAAAEKAAADKAAEEAAEAERGFPANTPVEDMTPVQQAAYWRDQSKKQQKIADSRSDYDAMKAAADELAQRKADEATEQEKALEAARQEGENIGAERYLRDAVIGRFQALTGRTDEEVATTFAHVDPKSFTDEKGDIVADKLKAFADTFGPKDGGKPVDHVAAALAAQRAAAGGAGSSIAEKRKQTRESMTKKTA